MSRLSIPRPHLVSRVLLVLGLVLVVAPALVPVDPVLHHETGPGTGANGSQLAQQGIRVVAYEDLSERGQELYRQTLLNGGRYTVPVGEGADEFNYTIPDDADDERSDGPSVRRPGDRPRLIAIERPPNSSLPPADEPVEMAQDRRRREAQRQQDAEATPDGNESTNRTTPSAEEIRAQVSRYDLMITRQDTPSLTATSNLVRLLSVVLGVLALGIGGYLGSKP